MIKVFLLDDHGLMRAGYRMMLEPHVSTLAVEIARCLAPGEAVPTDTPASSQAVAYA